MVSEKAKVEGPIVFFLIHAAQMGVGVLGFQRVIAKTAGYDGWITVLLTGLLTHLLVWMIYYVFTHCDAGDINDLHENLFGKLLSKAVNVIWISYFTIIGITILRTYIEVIQVWMFPRIPIWSITLAFVVLIFYIVNGGFKVVAGIAFFGVLIPLFMVVLLIFPIQLGEFRNLLPILSTPIKDIIYSTKEMTVSFLGFEALLVYYPFLKNGKSSQKWAHLGLVFTTVLYLIVAIVSFAFFSKEQLSKTIWATMSMFKIVELPFVERFEYIGVSFWAIVITPNVAIMLWAASRLVKQTFKVNQRQVLIALLILVFVVSILLKERQQINSLVSYVSNGGLALITIYFPVLFLLTLLKKKIMSKNKKRRKQK